MIKRRKRHSSEAELNVTSFMNLMIILVPVLLLNMIFSQISILDLKLPFADMELTPEQQQEEEQKVSLKVYMNAVGFTLTRVYQAEEESVAEFALNGEQFDFDGLSKALQDLKKNPIFADRQDISLLVAAEVRYQDLIRAMDSIRGYETMIAGDVVDALLFDEIALGDYREPPL